MGRKLCVFRRAKDVCCLCVWVCVGLISLILFCCINILIVYFLWVSFVQSFPYFGGYRCRKVHRFTNEWPQSPKKFIILSSAGVLDFEKAFQYFCYNVVVIFSDRLCVGCAFLSDLMKTQDTHQLFRSSIIINGFMIKPLPKLKERSPSQKNYDDRIQLGYATQLT